MRERRCALRKREREKEALFQTSKEWCYDETKWIGPRNVFFFKKKKSIRDRPCALKSNEFINIVIGTKTSYFSYGSKSVLPCIAKMTEKSCD